MQNEEWRMQNDDATLSLILHSAMEAPGPNARARTLGRLREFSRLRSAGMSGSLTNE